MSTTINQPTINPTRKLTAAVIATALMETVRIVSNQLLPGIFDPAFWAAMAPVTVFAVGYFVRDEPHVVAPVPEFTGGEPA